MELQRNSLPPGVSECRVVLKASLPNCCEVCPDPVSSVMSVSVTPLPTKPYFVTMVHRGPEDVQVVRLIRNDNGVDVKLQGDSVVRDQFGRGGDGVQGGDGGDDGVACDLAGDGDGGDGDSDGRDIDVYATCRKKGHKRKKFSITVSCTHPEEQFVVVSKKANAVFSAHVYFDDKEHNLYLTLARSFPVYTKVRCCLAKC